MKKVSNTKKKKKLKSNSKGFTLVELLAVIAILSVVVTIVIYAATNIVKHSKENSYQVTINNIEKQAGNYIDEELANTDWVNIANTGGDYQYQCVTVQNLIDAGYFGIDVLDSFVTENRQVMANDYIYIERVTETKSIIKNILLYDSSFSGLCSDFSATGRVSIEVSPSGWTTSKNVNITYTLNNVNVSDYSYYNYGYSFISSNVTKSYENYEPISFIVNNNGNVYAFIKDDENKLIASDTKIISKIDNTKPDGEILSTNNVASKQTVTLSMTDNESGVSEYYFGTSNNEPSGGDWKDVDDAKTVTLNTVVDKSGTWYLWIKDAVGNVKEVSKKFYKTTLSISNAKVNVNEIITMEGDSFTLPSVTANKFYKFNGWYDNDKYDGSSITTYKPIGDSIIYGNVTENKLTGGAVVINGVLQYGETLTADITEDTTPKADLYSFQWYTNSVASTTGGTKINGATSNKLVLKEDQFDKYIYVIITASKDNYRSVSFGNYTSKVEKRSIVVTASSSSKVYDGKALVDSKCSATNLVFEHKVNCNMTEASTITNVGIVKNDIDTVSVRNKKETLVVDQYYDYSFVDGTLEVTEKVVDIPTASAYCKADLKYNGSSQILTISPQAGYRFSNNSGVDAGNYNVTAILNSNYIWSDGSTTNKTLTCNISKINPTLKIIGAGKVLIEGDTSKFDYSYDGDGTLSCSSADDSKVGVTLDITNNKIDIVAKAVSSGVKVFLNASEGKNYYAASAEGNVGVIKKPEAPKTYKVNINYNINGGDFLSSSSSYTWTKDSNGFIYQDGKIYTMTVDYGKSLSSSGLVNYNNSTFINTARKGYYVESGKEWICLTGQCQGDVYSQSVVYNSSHFCNASKGDCTVELGVNWIPYEYTIKYNANGGSGSMDDTKCFYDSECSINNNKFTREGYNFVGWTTKSNGTDDGFGWTDKINTNFIWTYTNGQFGIADNTLNLYASWEKIIYNVNIRYSPAGGIIRSQTTRNDGTVNNWTVDSNERIVKNGQLYTMTVKNGSNLSSDGLANWNNSKYIYISRPGYAVREGLEWVCISGECQGQTYSQSAVYNSSNFCNATNGDCTVVLGVNWYSIELGITYNANGGSGSMASTICTYGNDCIISNNGFTRNNYTFVEWNTKSNGTGTSYQPGDLYTGSSSITLYAIWKKKNYVYINYNVNSGSICTTKTITSSTASSSSSSTASSSSSATSNDTVIDCSNGYTSDVDGDIYKDGELLTTSVMNGNKLSSSGLLNWNNESYLNISKKGYSAASNQEWKCLSNNCKNATYSHSTVYSASDFCDASNNDCTVILGVNWKDTTAPTVKFGNNGSNGVWIKTATTKITVSDDGSGVDENTLKYVFSTSSTVPKETASSTVTYNSFTNGKSVSKASANGIYYIHVKACDKASPSNCVTATSNPFKLDNIPPVITCNSSKIQWKQEMNQSCEAFNAKNPCTLDLVTINGGFTNCPLTKYDGTNNFKREECAVYADIAYCLSSEIYSGCDVLFTATDNNGIVIDEGCPVKALNDNGETCKDTNGESCTFKATYGNCLKGYCSYSFTKKVSDQAGNEASKTFTYYTRYSDGHYDNKWTIECIQECNDLIPRTGRCDHVYKASNCKKVYGRY